MDCIMEKLIEIVCEVLNNDLSMIDTHELGEVIDMIKDMSKVMYNEKVINAMDNCSVAEKMIPDSIRSHMYYMSEDHIVDDIKMLMENYTDEQKETLKTELINKINNL